MERTSLKIHLKIAYLEPNIDPISYVDRCSIIDMRDSVHRTMRVTSLPVRELLQAELFTAKIIESNVQKI